MSEDGKVSLYDFKVTPPKELEEVVQRIEQIFFNNGFQPPEMEGLLEQNLGPAEIVKRAYQYLIGNGSPTHVGEGIVFHKDRIEEAKGKLFEFLKTSSRNQCF